MLRKGSKETHQPEVCLQSDPEKEAIETVSMKSVSCRFLPTVFSETTYNICGLYINRTALNKYLSTVQGAIKNQQIVCVFTDQVYGGILESPQ